MRGELWVRVYGKKEKGKAERRRSPLCRPERRHLSRGERGGRGCGFRGGRRRGCGGLQWDRMSRP